MSEEQLNLFFKSPAGIGVTVIICCAVMVMIAGVFYRKKLFSTRVLTVSAVCVALSAILSNVKIIPLPQGGSVTAFSMLFIVLTGYWFGPEAGILAGIAGGLLNLVIDPFVVHPIQLLLDYPLAFGALGISGFFRKILRKNMFGRPYLGIDGLAIGYAAAVMARWFMSFISGYVFFSEYAGEMNPVIYSAVYNFMYILPEMFLTLIVLSVPPIRGAIDMIGRGRQSVG